MRIVQTFWSGNNNDLVSNTFGWCAAEYHLMSWTLSCLQLKKFYKEVILYTDQAGCDLLIEKLKLPYDKVYVELDALNTYHKDLWGLSKIDTYSKQKEPFLHVDGDVFIWKAFEKNLIDKPLIAQNLEFGSEEYYHKMFAELEKSFAFFPEEFLKIKKKENQIMAYNAGIFGGSDLDFFQKYTTKAFEFVDKNLSSLDKVNPLHFNVFFEQSLFYCLSKTENKHVSVLFEELIQDNKYTGLGDFEDVPHLKTYLHLIGPYKRDLKSCQLLSRRLREDYPEYHHRVLNLYPKKYKNTLSLMKGGNQIIDANSIKISDYFERTSILYHETTNVRLHNKQNDLIEVEKTITRLNNSHLSDVFSLEKSICEFTANSRKHSRAAILEREILMNTYHHTIFSKTKNEISKIVLKKSDFIKIVVTKWNWELENSDFSKFLLKIRNNQTIEPEEIKTVLVPEVEFPFYSENTIDELDELMIGILEDSKTIAQLISELAICFHDNDLNFSQKELTSLIYGRLKHFIFLKCICIIS